MNEIKNSDIILPGGIGFLKIGDSEVEIIQKFETRGMTILTISPVRENVAEYKKYPLLDSPPPPSPLLEVKK